MDRFILERKERRWLLHDLELRTAYTDMKGMRDAVASAIVWYLMIHGFDSMGDEDFEVLLLAAKGKGNGASGGEAWIRPPGPDTAGEEEPPSG